MENYSLAMLFILFPIRKYVQILFYSLFALNNLHKLLFHNKFASTVTICKKI